MAPPAPGRSLDRAQPVRAPSRGLPRIVKVGQAPAEHTEGRQSARSGALASHRQVLRRCRSELP
jgi:hypothetical protein